MSEEGKVFEFKKRFEDRFEPPKTVPVWRVTYALTKDTNDTALIKGYIASVMPTLTIMQGEESKTLNELVYNLPYDRLVTIERYEEQVSE